MRIMRATIGHPLLGLRLVVLQVTRFLSHSIQKRMVDWAIISVFMAFQYAPLLVIK